MTLNPTVDQISIVWIEPQWNIHLILVNNNTKSSKYPEVYDYLHNHLRIYLLPLAYSVHTK